MTERRPNGARDWPSVYQRHPGLDQSAAPFVTWSRDAPSRHRERQQYGGGVGEGVIDLRLLSAHLEELPDAGVVGADAVLVVPAGIAEDVEGLPRGAQAVQVAGAGRLQGRGQNGVALVAGDAEAGTLGEVGSG